MATPPANVTPEPGVVDPLTTPFVAYQRANSELGIRNKVLVVPSVICSHIVADRIADAVEGAVSLPHDHGCAQIGHDHTQTERTLFQLTQNPNVAGVTVVGLGCEHLQSGPFSKRIREAQVPVRETAIQEAGGSEACRSDGITLTEELSRDAAETSRIDTTLDELTIGIVSSDLAESTVKTANPMVGRMVDTLLDAGGRVLVAGTERIGSHADNAVARANNDTTDDAIREVARRYSSRPADVRGIVQRAAELSFPETVGTWGSAEVSELVYYGDRPTGDSGLVVIDTPSRFEEAATALAAAGATAIVHVTAEGIPAGHPVVPVLKVTGEASTAKVLASDIDIDARERTSDELLAAMHRVVDGKKTAAEHHGLTQFAINRSGPSQ